ncbi:uncharacterized protein LOC124910783 [Impatiens glandulifera]|uniref:uncharacterized protein LOC124910783 n=1 Tax=Impatiens glandulifera TaxID=253017 RepID=UPI001FB1725E|nr:uncharacterized protein LOC124910783 [Impatiens glandulifera]
MAMMMLSSTAGGGALSAKTFSYRSSPQLDRRNPSSSSSLFSSTRHRRRQNKTLALSNSDGTSSAGASTTTPSSRFGTEDETTVDFVGQGKVPLEGVIQVEKPNTFALINKWGRVGLLAGGDVLAILLFSAIGRFSHGFSVFDSETLHTADPFIAGWFLCAYFLGGYSEDGRGMNGPKNAVVAAAKSWSIGIPVGIIIRALRVGHIPQASFILVTMGSTAVLLIGWRALLFNTFLNIDSSKKNDTYKQGNPFELFELLTSLIRRW